MGAASYFDAFVHRKKDIRPQLEEAMRTLGEEQTRLRLKVGALQIRQNELLRGCALLLKKKDKPRAKLYAGEVVEISKVLETLQQTELAIEALRLRIGTARELGDTAAILRPVTQALLKVKHQVGVLLPEVATDLENTASSLIAILSTTTTPEANIVDVSSVFSSEQVDEIMDEASKLAHARMQEELENLNGEEMGPLVNLIKQKGVDGLKSLVTLIEEDFVPTDRVTESLDVTLVEDEDEAVKKVYQYIKARKGMVDLNKCTKELSLSREAVVYSLKVLEKQGKIKLNRSQEELYA